MWIGSIEGARAVVKVGKVQGSRIKVYYLHRRSDLSSKRYLHSFIVLVEPGFLNQIESGLGLGKKRYLPDFVHMVSLK